MMVIHGVLVVQVTRDGYTRSVGWTSHYTRSVCWTSPSLMIVIHGVSVVQVTRDGYYTECRLDKALVMVITRSVGWTRHS